MWLVVSLGYTSANLVDVGTAGLVGIAVIAHASTFYYSAIHTVVYQHSALPISQSSVVALVSVLFWTFILSPIGGMIAVLLTATLTAVLGSVILVSYPETKWIAMMMQEMNDGD